jgi:hypothetical protein
MTAHQVCNPCTYQLAETFFRTFLCNETVQRIGLALTNRLQVLKEAIPSKYYAGLRRRGHKRTYFFVRSQSHCFLNIFSSPRACLRIWNCTSFKLEDRHEKEVPTGSDTASLKRASQSFHALRALLQNEEEHEYQNERAWPE